MCWSRMVLQISVLTSGRGIDLPIYVEREEMDLRICMLDRLYQDSVMLHNRSDRESSA